MTSANLLNPRNFLQPFSALNPSLNTIVRIVALLTHPRVFAVRNRTVAKVDSIGLLVLM